jgi:hypothetical protein
MEKLGYLLGAILVVVVFSIFMAFPIMWLWNYALVPAIDGVNSINVLQALCLMFLSSILFKTQVNNNKND